MALWNDIRYGARTLRKTPGFAVASIVTLALGIGATTAIFSVADALLWKPVPLPNLDRLATILRAIPGDPNDFSNAAFADIDDVRRQSQSFEAITWWTEGLANIVGTSGAPERVEQYLVGSNFFDVIGARPAVGRGFLPGEDQPGREQVVMLSHGLWRRLFAGDPNIAGKTIRLDDQDFEVVGVMPANFIFPQAAELWTPYAMPPQARQSRSASNVNAMGLLRPGVTVAQARLELETIATRLEQAYPDTNKNRRFKVDSTHGFLIGSYNDQYVKMLFGASFFVLLIACTNVANLHFARASGRRREVAVRTALGAGRWRLVSQLITESVLLSLAGAAVGLLVASWGIEMIRTGMPAEIEKYITGWKEMQLDARTLIFTITAAVLTGILAGLAPAIEASRPSLTDALKEGGRGSSAGRARHRLRAILVTAQITLSVVLLVGASLMARGFRTLMNASTRLEPSTLLTFRLTITNNKYKERHQKIAFFREVLERLAAIPGAGAAVAVTAMPHSQHSSGREFEIEGRQRDPGNPTSAMYQAVSANYFDTLHVRLRSGRLLQPGDGADTAPHVAVISDRMAQRWWPGELPPVGKHIRVRSSDGKEPWATVVGVVDNIPHDIYERSARAVVYVPYQHAPRTWMDILVRSNGDPGRLAADAAAAVHSVDPEQPVSDLATMETLLHRQGIGLTYVSVLMGIFGILALALSSIGVYGVMSFIVSEQKHEIGIRMALGAERGTVIRMIFRQGMVTTIIGLVLGIGLAYAMARLMSSLIWGVTANDPATFVGIPVALGLAAALAIYIPADRATRIDPLVALRHE